MRRRLYLNKETGYSLLDSLLHLSAFVLFAHLSFIILLIIGRTGEAMGDIEEIEWELFSAELTENISRSESLTLQADNRGIQFMQNGERYEIEYYTGMIRKQKNGTGHEPLLLSVKTATFKMDDHSLFISITFKSGKTKERSYVVPA